jgi:hypothetical protein
VVGDQQRGKDMPSNDKLERPSAVVSRATRAHNHSWRPRRLSSYLSRPLQALVRRASMPLEPVRCPESAGGGYSEYEKWLPRE